MLNPIGTLGAGGVISLKSSKLDSPSTLPSAVMTTQCARLNRSVDSVSQTSRSGSGRRACVWMNSSMFGLSSAHHRIS